MKPLPLLFWCAALAAISLGAAGARAQSTVFVSRHADRASNEKDSPLTANGEARANALSLQLADARIRHIYVTEYLRSRQTAAPTSRLNGVQPVTVPYGEVEELVAKIRETAKPGESTLVVGHRESVTKIVKALSGVDIEPLGGGEYSRLVAVTLFPDGKSSVVTLRQGMEYDRNPIPEPAPPAEKK